MSVTVQVDSRNFDAAIRQALLSSKRTLGAAVNARMFFLMARVFMLVPPSDPQAVRSKFRDYLNTDRRVYRIANARARQSGGGPLLGQALDDEVLRIRRRAMGGVGYLRAVVVRAIKRFGSYNQFGRRSRNGKWGKLNAASVRLANQYGVATGNVAIFRRSSVRNDSRRALEGWNPVALVDMSGDAQNAAAVAAIYRPAVQRAMDDEADEARAHVAGTVADAVAEAGSGRGMEVRRLTA